MCDHHTRVGDYRISWKEQQEICRNGRFQRTDAIRESGEDLEEMQTGNNVTVPAKFESDMERRSEPDLSNIVCDSVNKFDSVVK